MDHVAAAHVMLWNYSSVFLAITDEVSNQTSAIELSQLEPLLQAQQLSAKVSLGLRDLRWSSAFVTQGHKAGLDDETRAANLGLNLVCCFHVFHEIKSD